MQLVRILEDAALEAAETAAWYEAERPGLGVEFFYAIDTAIDLLENGNLPLLQLSGNAGALGLKRHILKRFPYDVIVAVKPDETIVIAIAHHARKPDYWRDRVTPT